MKNRLILLWQRYLQISFRAKLLLGTALLVICCFGGVGLYLVSAHAPAHKTPQQTAQDSAASSESEPASGNQTTSTSSSGKKSTATSSSVSKSDSTKATNKGTGSTATGTASTSAAKTTSGGTSTKTTSSGSSSQPSVPTGPLLGALDPSSSDATLASEGFKEVVVSASWASIEPSEGSFSASALASVQSQINSAVAAGLSVSLDIGVQYAPSWVFSVGGGTYYTDQYGDTFSGSSSSGNDVPNAMTDTNVRTVMASYLSYLGRLTNVSAVRLGGGPYNELRFPSGTSGSQSNAFWFYDSSSQADLPAAARGWTPGSGTTAQATDFLNAYNAALINYGQWLVAQGTADFSSNVKLELMLPGWGERPGEATTAEVNLLASSPDEVNQGLDWSGLLSAIGGNSRVVAYSTYADATQGSSSNPDPAAYIHSILPSGMLAGGESTGNGGTTTAGMDLMFSDAKNWNWYVANWYFGGQSQSAAQVVQAFNGA